jgi:hypothetical protein
MECVGCGVRHLPPFAKSAKDGAPLVCGGVGKVHGSFVGSPWLCQGLRCLRMTAFRGRMRPFDNSSEDEAVRLMVSSFQNCHLERRERTRLRVCSRSRKTCYLPMRRTCRRVIAAECRQKSRSLDSARSSASGRSCCARDDRVEVGTMEFVCRGVRHLPPFAKSAKDGAPLVYGGVGKVHGSFIGSPWLCQGLRCLRMTAFRGRMRSFDNSCEDEAVRLLVSSFQSCHLDGGNGLACEFVPGVERPVISPRAGLAAG